MLANNWSRTAHLGTTQLQYSPALVGFTVCLSQPLKFNYPQCVCTVVYGVGYSPFFLLYTLDITVQPRLSGPRLSGTSIIRTSQRPKNTIPRMRRRRDRWSFVGVVIDSAMSYGLYRLALAKIDWPKYFSEHCWPWSYCIGIVYSLGIINQARNVGISVIRTVHLSGMAAIGRWTKGSG